MKYKFRKVPYEDWRGTVLGYCELKNGHISYYKSLRNKGGWGVSYSGGVLPVSGAEVYYSEESARKRYEELLPKRRKK